MPTLLPLISLTSSTGAYEPYLGVPVSNGQVLASTTTGVRSWATASGGSSTIIDGLTGTGGLADQTPVELTIYYAKHSDGITYVYEFIIDASPPAESLPDVVHDSGSTGYFARIV